MVLKLYGYPTSLCTRLVALVCKEKDIPYEFIQVDLAKGEHKAPAYLAIQPFGQVPYIDDDGFILYESRPISRYLIKKYPNQGTALIPTDPQQEALFEQAASVEVSHFAPHAAGIAMEKIVKPRMGGQPDAVTVEHHLRSLEGKLDVYETILGKQKYLAGDNLTLADLQHLPNGEAVYHVGHKDIFDKRPNVKRWWDEICARPTWDAVKLGP